MHITPVDVALISLSLACAAVQLATLFSISKTGLRPQFPVFFTYTAFCILMVALSLGPYLYSCRAYFYLSSVLSFIMMIIEFGVVYEIFINALKPYDALIDLAKMLFQWAALFLLVAAVLTAFATNGSEGSKIFAAVNLTQRSIRLIQCGLLLLFFIFERRLGLSWRTHSVSIGLGLGTYAAVDLCSTYLFARSLSPYASNLISMAGLITYLGVTVFWLWRLNLPEAARKNVLDSPSKLIFQRWNDVLMSSPFVSHANLAMASSESFLPSVERTVERVMARKMMN